MKIDISKYKTLDEISEEDQERAKSLIDEIATLWNKYGSQPEEIASPHLSKTRKLVDEIEKMGFLVQIEFGIKVNTETNAIETDIDIKISTLKASSKMIH